MPDDETRDDRTDEVHDETLDDLDTEAVEDLDVDEDAEEVAGGTIVTCVSWPPCVTL